MHNYVWRQQKIRCLINISALPLVVAINHNNSNTTPYTVNSDGPHVGREFELWVWKVPLPSEQAKGYFWTPGLGTLFETCREVAASCFPSEEKMKVGARWL